MALIKMTGADLPVWGQLEDGLRKWQSNEFVFNNPKVKECDYWFIGDDCGLDADNEAYCPRENIYLIMGETEAIRTYETSYVKQFENIISVQKKQYPVKNTIRRYLAPWFIGYKFTDKGLENVHHKTYQDLVRMKDWKKTKLLSVISSNKTMCEGHQKRLEFVDALREEFGDTIDIFGRGINPFEDKWDVLADYKYHIAIENAAVDDYITEKFLDPILAMSYPIYWGAPNIGKYYDRRSYSAIDIYHPEDAIRKIREIIDQDIYEQRKEFLWQSRNLILNDYNLFNIISSIVKERQSEETMLKPEYIKLHKGYLTKLKECIPEVIKDAIRRAKGWLR